MSASAAVGSRRVGSVSAATRRLTGASRPESDMHALWHGANDAVHIAAAPTRPYRDVREEAVMSATLGLLDWVGTVVARRLARPSSGYEPYAAARPELVA